MTSLYDRMRSLSKAQIDDKGQQAFYIRNSNPNPVDADKPWLLGPTTIDETEIQMLFLPDTRDGRETKAYSHRSEVPKGNTKALTYGLTFEPQLKDIIRRPLTTGDVVYSIEAIATIQPDDSTPLLYKFRLG